MLLDKHKLVWSREKGEPYFFKDMRKTDSDGSFILTLDLKTDVIGYQSKESDTVLDMSFVGGYDPEEFFEEISLSQEYLKLKKDKFYILSTKEAVRVPPELSCEMIPVDERSGEFRSHYAGFIDPGWGWGKDGSGVGRPLTLEIRPFEDLILRHGQPVAKIRYEHMADIPETHYDSIDSNYLNQSGPKLSKHFK